MRNIIDDGDEESESGTVGLSPDNNADLFLGVEDAAINLQELQPECVFCSSEVFIFFIFFIQFPPSFQLR